MIAAAFALLLAADFNIPPRPVAYVTDNAGVLSSATREAVENELHSYESSTGHRILVWIDRTTGGVPLETFTGESADRWKVGRPGHDDGAVLFLFTADRRVRIEVGYGLESKLTDADSQRIIDDDVVPRMRASDPNGAVSAAVADMLETVSPDYRLSALPTAAPQSAAQTATNGAVVTVMAIVFLLTFGFFAFVFIATFVGIVRYGYLIVREGHSAAQRDMKGWWFWGATGSGFTSGVGGFSFGGGGGGGLSSGGFGGGFGGGGASGGW